MVSGDSQVAVLAPEAVQAVEPEPAVVEASGLETEALAPEDLDWIKTSCPALQAFIGGNPVAQEGAERILAEYLRLPPGRDTSTDLLNAMTLYAGMDAANCFLVALMRGVAETEFLEAVVNSIEPQERPWLRLMIALHGNKVRTTYIVSGEEPNDWKEINHSVMYSPIGGAWMIKSEIAKYSGDKVVLEGMPKSWVSLASAALDPLLQLPPAVVPDLLDVARIKEVEEKCAMLAELCTPTSEEEEDSDEEGAISSAP